MYDNVCPKLSPSSSSLSSSVMELSSGTGSAGTTPGATTSAVMELSNGTETVSENSAPAGRSLSNPLAIGVAMLIWQAL